MLMIGFAGSVLFLALLSSVGVAAEADPVVDSPRLAALSSAIAAGDRKALEAFWREVEQAHAPLIEPLPDNSGKVLLTFLWRAGAGEEEINVGVASPLGEMYRAHAVPEPLIHLPQTDVWFRTYRASNRVRFEYALTWPQGRAANAQANDSFTHRGVMYETFPDPLNPKAMSLEWDEKLDEKTWADKIRRVSYAEGPSAPAEPFVAERAGVKRGQLTTIEFTSTLLGNTRRISIYTPPGLQHGAPECDFLLMFDRAEYVMAVPTPTILDNMQADRVIRPIVAVFAGNAPGAARSVELPGNPRFQAFLRQELLPWIRARYRFTTDPRRSVVGGSSFGGLASAYTAFTNPDVFGNVLSQSGSYWWWPGFRYEGRDVDALNADAGWMIRQYAAARKLPLRFYMDAGSLEGALMLLPNRTLRDLLQAKGYEVTYREYAGAHDYILWRSTISDGLTALLGATSSAAQSTTAQITTRATPQAAPMRPGEVLQDCADCPQMVAIPGGRFEMGDRRAAGATDERPAHDVEIGSFAIGRYEVTKQQYAVFARETRAPIQGDCHTDRAAAGVWDFDPQGTWLAPNFAQTERDPVVCVSWHEAAAYVDWLSRKTGHEYRLLSEAQWEYAARAGSDTLYIWGDDFSKGCSFANISDVSLKRAYPAAKPAATCDDRHARTAPVGSFQPNAYGVFDLAGNVWEWVQDCYEESYGSAPRDGRPHERGACVQRVNRGGSFGTEPAKIRTTSRTWDIATERNNYLGFRVARVIP